MIYGRRFFEKHQQRLSYYEQRAEHLQRSQRSLKSLYHDFQHKYARYFVFAVVGPLFLFAVPCFYFLQENYDIFIKLAYDVRPDLLEHLEREKNMLIGLIGCSVLCSGLFCYWLTLKLTALITGPIWAMERHMKQVTLGDWSSEEFRLRNNDEFQSLANTYSYLYRTLRVHTLKEIDSLESLGLDPRDRNAYVVLKNMIEMKQAQLGITRSDDLNDAPAAETVAAPSKRHAS